METEQRFDFVPLVIAAAMCVASASWVYDTCFYFKATPRWKRICALVILACSSPLVSVLLVAGGLSVSIVSVLMMYVFAFLMRGLSTKSMSIQIEMR